MPEVREAIGELGVIAREYMSTKAGEFVQNAFGEIKRHECNVNNDNVKHVQLTTPVPGSVLRARIFVPQRNSVGIQPSLL